MGTAGEFLNDINALIDKHTVLPLDIKITLLRTAISYYKKEKKKEAFLKKAIGKFPVEYYKASLN